ncbi:MAG TPA: hypothetical protein V6C88_06160 [Chroococcidiopsis sp.]
MDMLTDFTDFANFAEMIKVRDEAIAPKPTKTHQTGAFPIRFTSVIPP